MEEKFLLRILHIAFAVTVYFLTLSCYLAPVLFAKYWGSRTLSITSPERALQTKNWGSRCISWCNCGAAGVFLAICFLALLPYSGEKFGSVLKIYQYESNFPLSECIVVSGFLITLFLEQLLMSWREQREAKRSHDDAEQVQGLLEECEMQELLENPSGTMMVDHAELLLGDLSGTIGRSNHLSFSEDGDVNIGSKDTLSGIDDDGKRLSLLARRESGFLFYILAFASGLHSVFEGLALGLQADVHKAIHLFLAIILHQCLVSVALGVNAIKLRYSFCTYLKFGGLFFSTIPMGLAIGAVFQKAPSASAELASAVLQALAAGVFLHVVFQDFFPSEFSNRHDRMLKVFFVAFGFIVIALITYFIREN